MLERRWLLPGCVLLVLLPNVFGQSARPAGAEAQKRDGAAARHFKNGKQLIENNCIDCMGGTQAGVEQGIKEIEAALEAGYRNRKAAYELLSDAYAHMTTYTERKPEEEKAYTNKRAEIDRKLFELYPNDPDVLERYEITLKNDAERLEVLKRLVQIKPNPDSKFLLGYLLMKQRNVKDGLPLVRSAIATDAKAEAVMNYVGTLIDQLGELGCPLPEADSWRQRAGVAFDRDTSGAGDPKAMPEFKANFFAALDKVNCVVK